MVFGGCRQGKRWKNRGPRWGAEPPLRSSLVLASGPEPLDELFKFTINTFQNSAGRKLKPVEAHDIVCKIAEKFEDSGFKIIIIP